MCPLFAAVTLREDSAKRLERRARRVSACLSDYSLASDSGVFEPLTKRLGDDHLVSSSLSTLARALLVCTQRIYMELCLQLNVHVSASFSLWEVGEMPLEAGSYCVVLEWVFSLVLASKAEKD